MTTNYISMDNHIFNHNGSKLDTKATKLL